MRQSHGASVGQHQLALARRGVVGQVKEGDRLDIDLEESDVVVGVDAGHGGDVLAWGIGRGAAGRGHQYPYAGGVGDDMGVGDEIAIRRDKETRTAAALGHQNPGGLLVAGSGHFEGLGHDLNHLGSDCGRDTLRLTADAVQLAKGCGVRSRCRRGQHQQAQGSLQPRLV